MRSYAASAVIHAAPARIWAILTDGASYGDWDSGVVRLEGTIAPDERIKVVSAASPRRAFPVRVTGFVPGEEMTWTGGMPFGLFTGVRTFTLTGDGAATRFTVRETYTGSFLPLIWRSMPDLDPSFRQFADGLKRRAEAEP